jgi:nucleoside-diphosphate-sugar epimerase
MKNTILITGGAGFIGSHLAEKFHNEGFLVIIIDNLFRGRLENIKEIIQNGAIFHKLDLLIEDDLISITNLIQNYEPSIILHYAAINGTQYFYDFPQLVAEVNSIGTYNLMKCIEKNTIDKKTYKPVLGFASTSEVYGEPFEIPSFESSTTHVRIDQSRDSYSAAKLMSEFYIKLFSESMGIEWIIFRIFNVYGPKMIGSKYGQVIPEFINRLQSGEYPLNIFGKGQHMRSFIFINDHVELIYKAMQLAKKNEVYNIGNTDEITILDLAKKIMNLMNLEPNFNFLPERNGDHMRRKPSIDKLIAHIGPYNFLNLDNGLIKMLDKKH